MKKLSGKQGPPKQMGLNNFVKIVLVLTTLSLLLYIGLRRNGVTTITQRRLGDIQQLTSSHQCKGTPDISRVCVFQNLVLYKDTLYYIINDTFSEDITFHNVDLAIVAKKPGEGVIRGKQIKTVRYVDSPFVYAGEIEEVNIGLFQHRYAEVNFERALLTHTPLLHKHLCEKFSICSPEDGQDTTVVFWDDLLNPINTWETAAQQVWSCFSKNEPIELASTRSQTAYLFRNAVVGIGDQCLDFQGCNSRVVGTARRGLLWGNVLLEWREKIKQCSHIVKRETFKKDTRFIFKWKYEGPKTVRLDRDTNEMMLIRFIDQAEGNPKLSAIEDVSAGVEDIFGKHHIETKLLKPDSNLWDRIDLFTEADIIISPYWHALSGLMFMKNCSCLITVFPLGVEPIFYNEQVETLQYGNVGLPSYFGQHLQMYVFGYTIPNPANTMVDWQAVARSDERFNQLPEETRAQIQNELKCGREEWSKDCQLKWINEHATIKLDIAYFILSMRFAMKTTELCFKNTYPAELAYEMWPMSSCLPAVFEDLQGWLINTGGIGRVLPPGANFREICTLPCGVVNGWIHGNIVKIEEWDYPQECCDACEKEPMCNAWNFCQCFDRCGDYPRRSCILKNVPPSPYFSYVQGDINNYNRFIGGIPNTGYFDQIQQCSPKIIKDKESEEYRTKIFMQCASEDCNVETGNFTNSKFLDDEILQVITHVDEDTNMTPVECCQHCRDRKRCNIWTLCNSPEGCPCDITANGRHGCNNGMLKPFTCILKHSVNVAKGKQPYKFETGSFSSLLSGFLKVKKEDDEFETI